MINGIEPKQYDLSYDKIIKRTLDQSDELTIRFVNGLFGDDIPLRAYPRLRSVQTVGRRHSRTSRPPAG